MTIRPRIFDDSICYRCDRRATEARRFALDTSRFEALLCHHCATRFDQVFGTLRRFSEPCDDSRDLTSRCLRCDASWAGRRWFTIDTEKRVSTLCGRHLNSWDAQFTDWAADAREVDLDEVLTDTGISPVREGLDTTLRGLAGQSATRELRSLAAQARRAAQHPKPVYLRLPPRMGVDTGDWHLAPGVLDTVERRGLDPVQVMLAAVLPLAERRRYEELPEGTMLHSRPTPDGGVVHALVVPDKFEIVDAFDAAHWMWLRATKSERVVA